MQEAPRYDDVVAEVASFLEERLAHAVDAGIARTGSASTRASASARPRPEPRARPPGSTGSSPSGGRCSSGSPGSRRSRGSSRAGARGRDRRRLGGRRRSRRSTAGRHALPRARRALARRGARRRRCGRAGAGAGVTIELRDRAPRVPRRARRRAAGGTAVPRRPRARPRRRDGRRDRPDRGRGRLPRRRRGRRGGLRTRARTTCSRRSRPRSPTRSCAVSRSDAPACASGSRTSSSRGPVDHAAVVVERRAGLGRGRRPTRRRACRSRRASGGRRRPEVGPAAGAGVAETSRSVAPLVAAFARRPAVANRPATVGAPWRWTARGRRRCPSCSWKVTRRRAGSQTRKTSRGSS